VPAFNEEKVIVQTIASLLAAEHESRCEIVVVDDGSTDETCARVRNAFAGDERVRLYTIPNGGKAAALSFGVAHTDAEIVIALDADTVFTRDTITKLVRHFTDPRIGAVAGNAKVGNRINLLTRWQASSTSQVRIWTGARRSQLRNRRSGRCGSVAPRMAPAASPISPWRKMPTLQCPYSWATDCV
jgi:cellulose synthase/poly-beta-1,6-N-acetylglucosamine synthase-like glycosyltransferase